MLASWRRLLTQDKLVQTERTAQARSMLNQLIMLYGQTLGFVSFETVAKAVLRRAKGFGFNMVA